MRTGMILLNRGKVSCQSALRRNRRRSASGATSFAGVEPLSRGTSWHVFFEFQTQPELFVESSTVDIQGATHLRKGIMAQEQDPNKGQKETRKQRDQKKRPMQPGQQQGDN